MDKVRCNFPECQEGHYPLGYQEYENGEGEVIWGACPCCGGEGWEDCENCKNKIQFTDPSLPTLEDDAARLAGMQEGTGIV